jgi:hypothetical protein
MIYMSTEIITAVLFIIPTAIAVYLFFQVNTLKKRLDTLTQGIEDENLAAIVKKYVKTLETANSDINAMNEEFEQIRKDTETFFRKVGLVRYQAFKDTGGDQSFSLVLLNEINDGILITSLFGRDFTKMYAKKIESGSSSHTLTDEEQQALDQAISS